MKERIVTYPAIFKPRAFVALVSTDLTKSVANFKKTVRKNCIINNKKFRNSID